MANSWNFLSDAMDELKNDVVTLGGNVSEATKEDWNDFWMDDGYSLTGNPYASPDTITFGGGLPGGMGEDHISFSSNTYGPAQPVILGGEDSLTFNLDMTTSNNPNRFKYSEERILKELTDYISATYNQHYSSSFDAVQTLELIDSRADGESFCRSNIV